MIRTIAVSNMVGMIQSSSQARKYTAQNAAVLLVSRHDRNRTMCLTADSRPIPTVRYSRSNVTLNLSGENSSSWIYGESSSAIAAHT